MFWPLKGRGVSPRRFSTLQSAAVISDLPAPLLVPSTISGVGRNVLLTTLRPDLYDAALQCVLHITEILEARDHIRCKVLWTNPKFVI